MTAGEGPGDPAFTASLRLPHARAGQRIGLFGGSFDPPHRGHLMVSEMAMKRLRLDAIWWLVTPGNPLKEHAPGALARRVAAAQQMAAGCPDIRVTAAEATLGTRYTADTLRVIASRLPGVHLVWVMGADNLRQFHQWRHWRRIAAMMPIAVYDRPGSTLRATASPAARTLAPWRLPERCAPLLPTLQPPAWILLHGPRVALSSTELRAATAGTERAS